LLPATRTYLEQTLGEGRVMTNVYAPIVRALVAVALVAATATLMFVAVSTIRLAATWSNAII
jgi:multisubunit Na+/H+ antiporter MnhC subunit